MTVTEALEHRHDTLVIWEDPWPACGPEGNHLPAHVEHRATVHDVINMEREVYRHNGRDTDLEDRFYLEDFMTVHWARLEKK